jgi:enterochelin esterase-like enzyme
MANPEFVKTVHKLKSSSLKREAEVLIFTPGNLSGGETVNLLILNDGQEAEGLKLTETLTELYAGWMIDPVIVVAVKASEDRLQEYGVSGIPDFQQRGTKAGLYSAFIVGELFPFIQNTVKQRINGKHVIAGFSMGGLSAFDIAWNNPQVFDAVGVLSGSFWWRKKDLNDGYTPADRIMQQVVRQTESKPDLKFWIMTGTEDETEDRNHNFIIDSIDDAIDLIKDLYQKGYKRHEDITYYECVGGKHNVETWARALPAFLIWAFPRKTIF